MKIGIRRGFAALLLGAMPFEINLAPEDSTETNIQLFGGVGQYALIRRGCEGQVLSKHAVPFSEENLTINPYLNLEAKPIGIGGGYFWSRRPLTGSDDVNDVELPFSAYLRLGNRRAFYFSTSLLHHIPLYTGGYFQLGLGSGKNPNFDWWLGWGFVGPYDQGDIALFKSNVRLQRHFTLNVLGRVGFTEGISESAIGLGLTYR